MRSKEDSFLGKLEEENFLEKLELSYTPPIITKLTPMAKYKKNPYYKNYSKYLEIQG